MSDDDEPLTLLRSPDLDAARAEYHRCQKVFDGFFLHYWLGGGPSLKRSVEWAGRRRGEAFDRMFAIELELLGDTAD